MGWNKRLTVFWLFASVALTLVLSGVLWFVFDIPVFVGFLLLPFLWSMRWFAGGRRGEQGVGEAGPGGLAGTCPVCGWEAREPGERYCARDGARLRES